MASEINRFTANVDSPMTWKCPSAATIPRATDSWMPTITSSRMTVTMDR